MPSAYLLNNGMLDPNDPMLQQMAMQGGQVDGTLPPPPTPNPMSQNAVNPQALSAANRQDLIDRLKGWGNQRDLEMDKIKQYMQNYASLNQGTDYRPIAAFVGGLGNGNKQLYESAQAIAPETPQAKAENLLGFQQKTTQLANEAASANAMAKILAAQQQAAYQNNRLGIQQNGLDLRRDKLAQDMGNKIDNDNIIQSITKQQNQIALDKHTLDTAQTLTPQIFNELQQGLSNAIAGGKQSALGNLERTEYATAEMNLKNLQQRFLNRPEDINSPEFKQILYDTFGRLNNGYEANKVSRAQQIAGGRAAGLNSSPQAKQVLNSKVSAITTPSQSSAPAPATATKEWNGKTYQIQGDHWVEVPK